MLLRLALVIVFTQMIKEQANETIKKITLINY